ncbi:MAG: acyltransferase family protein [Lachnospiraceae bacterium]|nr:acyltransferase family protein [Lachnospiraceae bacterium]
MGILAARYSDRPFERCKKLYTLRVIVTVIFAVVLWYLGDNASGMYFQLFHKGYNPTSAYTSSLFGCIFQMAYAFAFVSLYYLLSMKIKIGNPLLSFFGKMTLELYLIHGIFIHMFGYYMIRDGVKPIYYIKNVTLFVLVVLALSIPVSYGMSIVDKKVAKLLRPKKKQKTIN